MYSHHPGPSPIVLRPPLRTCSNVRFARPPNIGIIQLLRGLDIQGLVNPLTSKAPSVQRQEPTLATITTLR
jgi:hypothetical protein